MNNFRYVVLRVVIFITKVCSFIFEVSEIKNLLEGINFGYVGIKLFVYFGFLKCWDYRYMLLYSVDKWYFYNYQKEIRFLVLERGFEY